MDKRQFELIKKELEKYPLKVRYIYLLQLQKYIEKTTKEPAILKEIDTLLKEIESKFSHDSSWKRDILTTLMSSGRDEESGERQIQRRESIEELISQAQTKKQEEQPGVRYSSSPAEDGYSKQGYLSNKKSNDLYSTSSSRAEEDRRHESVREQKEKFEAQGYHKKSIEEEAEEHHKGRKNLTYQK